MYEFTLLICLGCGKIGIVGKDGEPCQICGSNTKHIPKENTKKYMEYYMKNCE
jgi:rRNA maturation endonuclease Nob1